MSEKITIHADDYNRAGVFNLLCGETPPHREARFVWHRRFGEYRCGTGEQKCLKCLMRVNLESNSAEDDLFVSPVKKSIRVKMKFKIGGRVKVLPVDESDAVYFD